VDEPVRFRLLPSAPELPADCLTRVREALLPILVWPGVPVERLVSVGLTAVERFFLEAALALRRFRARDVEEITALPRLAVHRLADRMAAQGALTRVAAGLADEPAYDVVPARAQFVLDRQEVFDRRQDKLTFLYLPRTDDLVVYSPEPGGRYTPTLEKIRPAAQYPLAGDQRKEDKFALLARRVAERSAAQLPGDLVAVAAPPQDQPIPAECPAYRCRAELTCSAPRRPSCAST
jgi:hypothetical protein